VPVSVEDSVLSMKIIVLSRKGVKTLFVECVESCSLPFRIIRLVSFRITFCILVFIFVFRKIVFTETELTEYRVYLFKYLNFD